RLLAHRTPRSIEEDRLDERLELETRLLVRGRLLLELHVQVGEAPPLESPPVQHHILERRLAELGGEEHHALRAGGVNPLENGRCLRGRGASDPDVDGRSDVRRCEALERIRPRLDAGAPAVQHLELLPDDVATDVLQELQELEGRLFAEGSDDDHADRVLALPLPALELGERPPEQRDMDLPREEPAQTEQQVVLDQSDLPRRLPLQRGEPLDELSLLVEHRDRGPQVLLREGSTGDTLELRDETAVLRDQERDRGRGREVLREVEHVRGLLREDPGEDPVEIAAHIADVRKDERIERVEETREGHL